MASPGRKSFIVIGAGIVGLATARELKASFPDSNITVLEKEADVGRHQTGHNSGVIHSGIYYPPGSLKDTLCREGGQKLELFCQKHSIPTRACGKLIVATQEKEALVLDKLFGWAVEKGMANVRECSGEELRRIEPALTGIKALYLPDVKLVDFYRVSQVLRQELEASGIKIHLHQKVIGVAFPNQTVRVDTDKSSVTGDFLINCAGLYSDLIARLCGLRPRVQIIPFRGQYLSLQSDWAQKIKHMIYPAPDPTLPFLGIHITPSVEGERLHLGPNALLAFAREGYSWKDISLSDTVRMLGFGGFWKMAARYGAAGLKELSQSLSKKLYAESVQVFVPGIAASDLSPAGAGVRAQAVGRDGTLIQDFIFEHQPYALHVLNAPSPAATASLAIAKRIVGEIPKN